MRIRRLIPCLLLLLLGCQDQQGDGQGKVYRHSLDGAPGSLDPAHASSLYAKFLAVNLYDTLYRYRYLARPYEITPNLAVDLPDVSADGLVYTIRIKPGTRFTDDPAFPDGVGREVTAHDFVYSIKRHFDPASLAQGAWLWQGRIAGLEAWKADSSDYAREVSGLQALNDHTIQITLTSPFPQLVHTLAQGYAGIVPREAVERYGREFANHPVGSGPFTLTAIDSARAILAPNPRFRQEPFDLDAEGYDPATQGHLGLDRLAGRSPPFIERLQIDFIAEDAARWNALMAGNVHFIKVPVSQFDRVLASRNPIVLNAEFSSRYHFESEVESGFVYTNFNLADERLGYHPDPDRNRRNHALRCAITDGFDWIARNHTFYYGIGQVFSGIIPPVAPEFDPARRAPEYNPAAARERLAQHGWNADTLPVLEYGYPSSVTERQMFEQFRSFMLEIGWPREKIRPLTYATYGDYFRAYSRREVLLITSSWTMDYPDAENTMQLYYGPNASPGSNSSNYNNPEFDALYRRSAAMLPSPERTELYRQMNQLVIDDCAAISGISRNLLFLWHKDAVMLPDRSFVSGFFLRFVDLADAQAGGQ
jgi:ABC-type transport system substrate-binding protein